MGHSATIKEQGAIVASDAERLMQYCPDLESWRRSWSIEPRNIEPGQRLIGFITPLRDGMNLVAKEFIAAQDPENPGVLVLSNMTGAARELDAAVIVNPYDVEAVAEGLAKAVVMPLAERRERWESSFKVIRANDIHHWRKRYVKALEA